ncbi:hypothetical protein B0A48_12366 [Cryoendolithus antarcticus]|uniref:Rhodopsin domain-containing protein n=1 Tax=Cryoendolithus antarcticus TaxID=1507870 RepID=A0A1V8SRU7_9PEZI|nr:hypothetical protein B0A48_12366 [Cryoendolithus antarcticus]
MATLPTGVPSGYGNPPYGNDENDRGGWAVVAGGVALLFVAMFGAMRVYIRFPFNGRLLRDDATVFAASIFAIIQTILIIAAANLGLGKSASQLRKSSLTSAEKVTYASDIFYVVALYLSKAAVLFLLLALSREKAHELLMYGALGLCGVGLVASVVMAGIGCDLTRPWASITTECTSYFPRWIAIEIVGIAVEVYLFAVLLRMLAGLQRNWKGKYKAVAIFSLRLPLIVLAAYRLMSIKRMETSTEPNVSRTATIAWTEAALAYGLVTATLPSLVPFLTGLNTGLGSFPLDNIVQTSHGGSSGGAFAMGYLKHEHSGVHQGDRMRPENLTYKSSAVGKADQRSIESDDSQRVIIRRTVDVSFSPAPPDDDLSR